MPDPTTQPATQQQGGAPPAESQQQAPAESEQQPNGKGWEAAKQFKAELDSTKAKLAAVEAAQSKREQDEAAKNGQYEKLWKDEIAKREVAEKNAATLFKRNALTLELGKLGVQNLAAAELVDLSAMDAEGKNAPEIAQKLAASFGTGKSGAPFPTPSANPGNGRSSYDASKPPTSDQIRAMTSEEFQAWAKAKDSQSRDPLSR